MLGQLQLSVPERRKVGVHFRRRDVLDGVVLPLRVLVLVNEDYAAHVSGRAN